MKFGPLPLAEADGAILAHTVACKDGTIRKGTVLTADHLAQLRAAGVREITVARLCPEDATEDAAATALGACLAVPGLTVAGAFTGRVNLMAEAEGIVRVDGDAIAGVNGLDEGLSLATLADYARVGRGQMVATVKIIPYGIAASALDAAKDILQMPPIRLHPFKGGRAQLVMTRTPGFRDKLIAKGETAVRARVEAIGYTLADVATVPHDEASVAAAFDPDADLILILGASATSDRADVAPAAVSREGGAVERFGMPVDPGNLLFLGRLGDAHVVGLPGCARSPALNGVDWVLERLAAGIAIDSAAIAAMGVGGLLKEMPGRPEPRQRRP